MMTSGKANPKIVFLEVEPWEKNYLRDMCPEGWRVQFHSEEADRISIRKIKDADILSVFIYSDLDAGLLDRLPRVRLIATRSTGYDHIDIGACRKKGIGVSHVPTYGANTVAEHVFALILSLSRKIHSAREKVLRGHFSFQGLTGFDLMGKVLGVIGTGQIGRHVIRIAKGFQMEVLAYDPFPDPSVGELLGFEYVPLEILYSRADVITLHCPLNPNTRHMVDEKAFGAMKRGTLLINTARGGLIDTGALIHALDRGIVSGAGLDVLEEEEAVREERELLSKRYDENQIRSVIRNHVLLKDERVIITPHIAFNSQEAVERILKTTVENIAGYLRGHFQNRVA